MQVSAGWDPTPGGGGDFRCDLGRGTNLSVLCCPRIKPEVTMAAGLRGERYGTAAAFAVRSLRGAAVRYPW